MGKMENVCGSLLSSKFVGNIDQHIVNKNNKR